MLLLTRSGLVRYIGATLVAVFILAFGGVQAQAQDMAFKQAVAEAAALDRDIAEFYRDSGYAPVWTGKQGTDRKRRNALIKALNSAPLHGLPADRYNAAELTQMLKSVRSPRDLGKVEVAMSKAFISYARDVQSGILTPSEVDSDIKRKAPLRDRKSYLTAFVDSNPAKFMRALPPQTGEYARLLKARLQMEQVVSKGGWGPKVPGKKLEPGDSGNAVVALRNRLIAMGYLKRSSTRSYDATITKAVQKFQAAHGLADDGVAGATTLQEINVTAESRLKSVLVAMERERWFNRERGKRHVLVNLTDYTAKIMDNGKVTFRTRSVVGANKHDRRSPEFSDLMEHMIINPTWNVPRSIAVKEYLPMMQKNANAAGHLKLLDGSGRSVSRANIDFSQYDEKNFPFDMKQPPSRSNALGLVKFMFPNRYNIYLHDTPAKSLFARETRAYSHGCIRLQQPFEFAYALLKPQSSNPKGEFHGHLKTGRETQVNLETKVPVHIIYRTALTTAKGQLEFRRDVYGRDGRIWKALASAGVALGAVQG
ncbi:L,D-transpeptidase family protein [Thalassovita sp.]|jgi:murein L,D-transpeptidase YcbB/YkuD|uniref:L,D-transpeptidase family protein n=1 Tax=Thalassovita sp. TaxID=1979401 RepID=UPI003B5A0374